MNPYKPQHAVTCAHCRERRADDVECPGCRLAVCGACRSRPRTCRRPRAIVAQLGRGARLRGVDPDGEVALVSSWTGKLKLWDLDASKYAGDVDAGRWLGDSPRFAGLARDRRVIDRRTHLDINAVSLCNCGEHEITLRGEHVASDAGIDLWPMPRSVLDAGAYDCASRLLAVASHDQLVVFRRADRGRFERIGSARIEGEPVCWLGVAGDRVAALTRRGRVGRLRGYRCATSVFYPLPFYEWIGGEHPEIRFRPVNAPPGDRADPIDDDPVGVARDQFIERDPVRAALSADGRFAVLALTGSVAALHDLDLGRVTLFADHSDGLCHVALPASGRLLVTGDNDNRIIARERDGDTFARWLVV